MRNEGSMSDRPKVLKHPYGTYLMVRPEFVLLRDDDMQARIMRIIEGWMEHLKEAWQAAFYAAANAQQPLPPEPDEYWVTISQSQFIAQLYMFDAGKVNRDEDGKKKKGKANRDKQNIISKATLRKAINALVADKIIFIRPQPGHEFESAQYTLNVPYVQALEDKLPKSYLRIFGGFNDGGHSIFSPGGDTKIECPPHSKNEPPTSNNGMSPHEKIETGDMQNLKPLIDSQETTEKESTYAQSANAFAPHTQHFDEEEDGRDNSNATDRTILVRSETHSTDAHNAVVNGGTAGVAEDMGDTQPLTATSTSLHIATSAIGKTDVDISLSGKLAELHKTNTPVVEEKPKRPSRKPKACGTPEEMVRINAVFDAFDALAQECFKDADYRYARPKTDCKHIKDFLALKPAPTLEKLQSHYRYLFNKPKSSGPNGDFLWADNMTIAAVLRNYGSKPQIVVVPPTSTVPVIPEETPLARKYRLQKEQYAGVGGGH